MSRSTSPTRPTGISAQLHSKLLAAQSHAAQRQAEITAEDSKDDDLMASDEEQESHEVHFKGNAPISASTSKRSADQIDSDSEDSSDDDNLENPAKLFMKSFMSLMQEGKKKKPKKSNLDLPDRYGTTGPKKSGDKVGPPLQDGIPELLNTIFRSIYSQKEIKEALESIERPENCDALKPVRINKEIYSRMTEKERKKDEPLKYISNAIAKAAQPLAYA